MDPVDKLIETRKAIDASVEEFASLIGFKGDNAADNYRQLERGKRAMGGPLLPLLDALEPGLDIGTLRSAVMQQVPEFVELRAAEAGVDFEGIMHMRYPRFIGLYTGLLPEALLTRIEAAGYARVSLQSDVCLGDLVAVPLDPYPGDLTPLLRRAAGVKSS